ncbi:glycosyltransferase family 10 [Polynucleobacter sp. IMCC30063]|uniref:glycosyltransferase family 10 domain-containing protein n=1 Tax=Polynucleobacter sp. IMCC30063 TaxID=2907298 RepID=UPI001F2129E9|nr:glycosyltransferase family 10 [Polynucleobacter sp. IMCC30063]MCE7505174.1 glycosyltransferase family 10 [Polynucleobacter sp. IMCC30063]
MLIGSIIGWEVGQDDLFNPQSPRNRDDCLEPFRVLKAQALACGIELHTLDVIHSQGKEPDFNLYIESIPLITQGQGKNYLIRFETELTVQANADAVYLQQFDGIFTWDKNLLEANPQSLISLGLAKAKLHAMTIPNPLPAEFSPHQVVNLGFSARPQFCILIASNRHANRRDERELYSERVKAIRWFETNAPSDFVLYGHGWKVPQKRFGMLGKMRYRLAKVPPFLMGKAVFPSYGGPVNSKFTALSQARFSICFENARDIRGYLTEKIFDCLFAGCVPIYWGDPEVEKAIPKNCFIDFRQFQSYGALYSFLKDLSAEDYQAYQIAGQQFLASPQFQGFSSAAFAQKIIASIQHDFALT